MKDWWLFLDDEREPTDPNLWIVARSYSEAVSLINNYGFPQAISFDHDLGPDKTGADLADWLGHYLLDNNQRLPNHFQFWVHSQNPIGAKNIKFKMQALIKFFSSE